MSSPLFDSNPDPTSPFNPSTPPPSPEKETSSPPPITERIFSPGEIFDEIRLSLADEVGTILTRRLLDHFGSYGEILRASETALMEVSGIGPKTARQIIAARNPSEAENLIKVCEKESISILVERDARYPTRLKEIYDPPTLLYVRGELAPEDAFAIGVVGTRGISYYGKKQTTMLAGGLAREGFTIISGLARGVDGAAHEAALAAGGRTIAVLGSGVLNIYPSEHIELAERIAANGAVISEFHPLTDGRPGNFPRRNRIVSGMSLGVLVVESPRKSGSLITARLAMEQNREVFAVPGPIDVENSRGCNRLIRDGATLVESVGDIIENLGPLPVPTPVVKKDQTPVTIRNPIELRLNDHESRVLALVESGATPIDSIIARSGLTPGQVISTLSVLESKRLIQRLGGNKVRRI